MTSTRRRVIVVGAGLAGLTAAYELVKQPEFEVVLVEARERIGGRVRSIDVCGVSIDLGAFLIFPWYRRYRQLCRELGVEAELREVPDCGTYYDLGDGELVSESGFGIRLRSLVKVATRSLSSVFFSGQLDHPNLDHFRGMTIRQCIERWEPNPDEAAKYEELLDTLCQGYCYPPIAAYKAAFAAPIYPRSLLLGSATDSDMLRHGADSLTEALLVAFVEGGGELRLGCEASGFDGRVQTSAGAIEGERFVFALTADHPLYRDLLPDVDPIEYTRFVTAVVTLERPYREGDGRDPEGEGPEYRWGAIFRAPRDSFAPQVLSIIHLQRLYEADALALHYTVNIRCEDPDEVDDAVIASAVEELLCGGNRVREVVASAAWREAMPISRERVVELARANQGVNGCYFAGDFLGCPSMEVAVRTGLWAAELIVAAET